MSTEKENTKKKSKRKSKEKEIKSCEIDFDLEKKTCSICKRTM